MAAYHFGIKSTQHAEDLGGMEFADDAAAVAFGNEVIQDLVSGPAKQHDDWTMEITEGERAVRSVPFGGTVRKPKSGQSRSGGVAR